LSIRYHQISADEVAEKVRDVLSIIPEVRIAVLFGSVTRRKFVRDVDVGVCLDPEPELKGLIRMTNVLEDALGMPVDVVPLRKASPKLRLKALLKGVRLIVRDRELYAFLVSEALSEAVDMDVKLKENSKLKC
jgi:predicted nucleotidyltransferase